MQNKEIRKKTMTNLTIQEMIADRLHLFLSDMGFPMHGRMKQAMQEFGWTESQAGKTLRGEQYPTIEMLIDMCNKYAVNLNWLLCGRGPMTRKEDMVDAEAEALVWEAVNQLLVEENINLGNAKRVMVYHFAKRIYDRTQSVDIEAVRDFVLSTNA